MHVDDSRKIGALFIPETVVTSFTLLQPNLQTGYARLDEPIGNH